MPTILPISDLRNYTDVLNRVDIDKPVYLTRNGRGTYVITKLDDFDHQTSVESLIKEIEEGEKSLKKNKTTSIEKVAKKLNIQL